MKIVINTTFGGFKLTDEMMDYVGYEKICEWDGACDYPRTDPKLIEFLERYPDRADSLKVVEIPDNVDWEIEEYDGAEWISEKHRTWR
jgi:predicted GTPase